MTFIFKETQQLGLRRSRQFPDFVKEQGAAVRQLEFARLIAHRSVKAPRTCPNTSSSKRFSAIAVQVTS